MVEYRNIKFSLLLVALSLCVIILPGQVHAVVDDEKTIEALFGTYGKDSVVKVIKDKRHGKITIEKNKSFTDGYGKPNLLYITPKSVVQDLMTLEMSINQLTSALEELKKQQQKEDESKSVTTTDQASTREAIPLSVQLKQKINLTKEEYNKAESNSDRRRLKQELSILQSAYNRAKKNEKSKLRVYFPDKKKTTIYKNSSSACTNAKSRLQKIANPVYRHQVYFCGDWEFRKKNRKTCQGYSGRYSLKEYKEEVNRLRSEVSKKCEM